MAHNVDTTPDPWSAEAWAAHRRRLAIKAAMRDDPTIDPTSPESQAQAKRAEAETWRHRAFAAADQDLFRGYLAKCEQLKAEADRVDLGHAPPEPTAEVKREAARLNKMAGELRWTDPELSAGYAADARQLLQPGKD